jgi:16S rRNA processing protein RimM
VALASRLCLGVIVGAKGLRGEVRVKSFTERPADVAAYGPLSTDDGRSFALTVTGKAQGVVIARIKGVADRTAAEQLKGLKLYVDRAVLPAADDGTYYHADLVGLAAVLAPSEGKEGETLGTITAVYNFGGGDMVEVKLADGRTELVPFSDAAIAGVDIGAGTVTINPLPGLFENDSAADEIERRKEEQEENDT